MGDGALRRKSDHDSIQVPCNTRTYQSDGITAEKPLSQTGNKGFAQ